ncbi:MAG: YfaP family protein, partial [Vicinamibacterales bacterium]
GASNLFNGNVGASTTASSPVGAGFQAFVRVFAVNACGTSAPTADFVLGLTLGEGDLQVTLSWDTTADMDLHVIEPDGTHVYYAARTGHTARLDVDDTNGFGPENIFVNRGSASAGTYQVFIVHYGGSTATNATIQVRLNAGTANERYAVFTRTTPGGNPSLGFNVADVNVGSGTIAERSGTRASIVAGEADAPPKRP